MKQRDLNKIARLEKAISEKYGRDAIQNPKGNWTPEKEKEYIDQLKVLSRKEKYIEDKEEKIEIDGFLASKKLISRKTIAQCPICSERLKQIRDDIYMTKYNCCTKCYIDYVEGREERWLNGWRPDNDNKKQA